MDGIATILPFLMSGPVVAAISQAIKKVVGTHGPVTLAVVAVVAAGLNLLGTFTGTVTPDVSKWATESVVDLLTAIGVFSFIKTLGEATSVPEIDPRG